MKNGYDSVVGAILAGGDSRRMGRDKAMLEVAGRSLLARAVEVMQATLPRVVIVAPRRRGYDAFDVDLVPDTRPGLGPLGGLETALLEAGGSPVFLLACDMPFVGPEVVRWVLRESDSSGSRSVPAQVTVVEEGGRLQPLCALYRGSCLTQVERAVDSGDLSIVDLVDRLQARRITIDRSQPWYHSQLFASLNEPADVELWRNDLEGSEDGG